MSRGLKTSAVFRNIFRNSRRLLRVFSWDKTTLWRLSLAKLLRSPGAWPGKVHSCSAKPDGPRALLAQAGENGMTMPPLVIPRVPHGEQERRKGGQKFLPQQPKSVPAQEIQRRSLVLWSPLQQTGPSPPGLPGPLMAPESPSLSHGPCPTAVLRQPCCLFHGGAQPSSSLVLRRRRPLLSCVAGRVESWLLCCPARGASPPQGSQVCMLVKSKYLLTEQTEPLQRTCCSTRHLSLAGMTIQQQLQH